MYNLPKTHYLIFCIVYSNFDEIVASSFKLVTFFMSRKFLSLSCDFLTIIQYFVKAIEAVLVLDTLSMSINEIDHEKKMLPRNVLSSQTITLTMLIEIVLVY
jgi:hypothetical protein